MPRATALIFTALLFSACTARRDAAPQQAAPAPATRISIGHATRAVADPRAELTLQQIEPKLDLPAPQPTTRPTIAPLDALELYARARDALASRHHATAISSLENAIRLDPGSAELHRTLARAYMAGNYPERAIDALRRACQLDPADVRSQTSLGRLFLMRNDPETALTHLRLAVMTRQYQTDEPAAAVADYFLARALQQQGYDRAAVEQYETLLARLAKPSLALRSDPELSDWAERPAAIFGHVARLYEKRGEQEKALAAWRVIAADEPADIDARSRVIDLLISIGQRDEALREAADLVRRNNASSQSLQVLREAGRRTGRADAVYQELRRLYEEQRDDRTLLFALVDLLTGDGRDDEAEKLLDAAAREHWDHHLVSRLFDFYTTRHRSDAAARLLIEASAAKPNYTAQYTRPFLSLLRTLRRDALRADDVQRLEVAPAALAAREYFLALCAEAHGRATLARESSERAVAMVPLFPPAFRSAIRMLWTRGDITREDKERIAAEMIARAEREGSPTLVQEMRGYQLAAQGDGPGAMAAFERAIKAGGAAPDSLLAYAELQLEARNRTRFEQICWRAISDFPTYDDVYRRLFSAHLRAANEPGARNAGNAAINVLQRWIAADPYNVEARTTHAHVLALSGQTAESMRLLADLVREHPEEPLPLGSAASVYRNAGQTPQLIEILEELLSRAPDNVNIALHLAQHYAELHRRDDALRVADKVRNASQGNARMLFLAAQVYSAIEQKEQAEALMVESHRLNPKDPGVCNDLGYNWADEGRNLERAESMIRLAVDAEPDNASFLDSLGWVLYKRGRLEEARRFLEQSLAAESSADPVVLDHLGDTLYRLHNTDAAKKNWQRSIESVKFLLSMPADGLPGDDARRKRNESLRAALSMKLQQAQSGLPVKVAPLSSDAPAQAPVQAKN